MPVEIMPICTIIKEITKNGANLYDLWLKNLLLQVTNYKNTMILIVDDDSAVRSSLSFYAEACRL